MPLQYSKTSAYALTGLYENYLDVMVDRPIPKLDSDMYWTIPATYNLRPDLLANDIYEDAELWWVFARRNPDVLVNPLLDFKTGTKIYLPTIETLRDALGF